MTRVLVWQWGRRGGAPRFATALADGLRAVPGTEVTLSLSRRAEILRGSRPPRCDLPIDTYASAIGFLGRVLLAPFALPGLVRRVRALQPDVAICALPGPLDLLMATTLRLAGVKFAVVVHDAQPHPGDGLPCQAILQSLLCRQANGLIALSGYVAGQLRMVGGDGSRRCPLLLSTHPPMVFHPPPPPAFSHGGRVRLLSFGRLLTYKGLELLADTMRRLGPRDDVELRVVGDGPETPTLAALRALPCVSVENRWVPEDEIGALFGWADAVVLTYTEASQSGVAATALAAGRHVVATRVGGLVEQLRDEPQATLCAPDASSLAAALRGLIAARPAPAAPIDARLAWQEMATGLLRWLQTSILSSAIAPSGLVKGRRSPAP